MLILDDILLSPLSGVLWVFRKLYHAAQQELASESETITIQLSELYMGLETGKITNAEFEAVEKELLDRLDEIEAQTVEIGYEDEE